ncbi:hypothetical protein E1176_16100 [Fulvivirga sp. RKSG066]|uniref:M48 family metallopeptidase n=1 Tax=Fulvivirga aurantia TaxID=2529383 RepID=UPI0012BCC56B|nr:M48 family metallopeptidase [Fulvivirga aurantia]MTI22555.1 hypothetical protein [Fulvivirga aurantia]
MRYFLSISLLFLAHLALGQEDFTTPLPEGFIPTDFTQRSSFKYNMDVSTISKDDQRFERKSKKKFYLTSNFGIDEFLHSGKVLFNDPITSYLNSVLYEVLKEDQETFQKLRLYAVKSPIPNAFATNNGMIFINLGLLSKLENEAQLAFILSHEIIHYKNKHVVNRYVTNAEITRGKGEYNKFSQDQQHIARSSFSKELELEADTEGLSIFNNTRYKKDSIQQIFDILLTADQLLLQREFTYSFLEDGRYNFPTKYKLEDIEIYSANENYNDEKSTHPNSGTRKSNILSLLSNSGQSGKEFIISESKFYEVKALATQELCRQYLLTHQFAEALYLAYDLLDTYPNSLYLKKTIAKALYGHAVNKDSEEETENEPVIVSASLQKINYLLEELSLEDRLVLALKNTYELYHENPNDEELKLMTQDLVDRLKSEDKNIENKLFNKEGHFNSHAFDAITGKEELRKSFKTRAKKPTSRKRSRKKKKPAKINKTLVINPLYIKIDERKKNAVRFADSEDVLVGMTAKVHKASQRLKMKNAYINTNSINRNDIEEFRNHAVVNEWLSEKFMASDSSKISPIHNELKAVIDSYGVNHITWMGAVSVTQKVKGKGILIGTAILMPVLAPISIVGLFTPDRDTIYLSLTFNADTERVVSADVRKMNLKDSESLLQSNIYYSLFKLKHGK